MANYSLSTVNPIASISVGVSTLSASPTGTFAAVTSNSNFSLSLTGLTRNTYHKSKRPFTGQLIPRHGQAGRDV
tara:strand:- start:489 stop:710 length:222 start_codon:yes stop_codon:yes gene_type:complete